MFGDQTDDDEEVTKNKVDLKLAATHYFRFHWKKCVLNQRNPISMCLWDFLGSNRVSAS
jgi:hypothetical protein